MNRPMGMPSTRLSSMASTPISDGNGQLLGKDLGHGSVDLVNVAHAQITVQGIPPEMADLHRQRVQQAHGLQPGLDLCLGHFS